MVTALDSRHPLGWLSPSPMWGAFGDLHTSAQRRRFAQPAILRFATDGFMEELMATLALQPEKLAEWQAQAETWERPMPTPTLPTVSLNEPLSTRKIQSIRQPVLRAHKTGKKLVAVSSAAVAQPLKLYQPVQNRFYLVSASLVCQRPGLPDRHINPGKQEQVSFVVRRHIPPAGDNSGDPLTWDSYAFVPSSRGPQWRRVQDGTSSLPQPGEERLPMFSLGYSDVASHGRRIFAGMIPVGRREAYVGATINENIAMDGSSSLSNDVDVDTRVLHFSLQVTGPWHELINAAQSLRGKFSEWNSTTNDAVSGNSGDQKLTELIAGRERIQTGSWYILLDFYRFLNTYIQPVAEKLAGGSPLLSDAEDALLTYLGTLELNTEFISNLVTMLGNSKNAGTPYGDAKIKRKLSDALAAIAVSSKVQSDLEAAESIFSYKAPSADWPQFLFPLADFNAGVAVTAVRAPCPISEGVTPLWGGSALGDIPTAIDSFFDTLISKIQAALPARGTTPQPEINVLNEVKHAEFDAWFSIRCVYERPNCGRLEPPLLSAPTVAFRMASYFDPEAPARAVRIPMPFDITPATLRKYNKSATLVVSDMLCGQLKRIRKLSLGDLVLSVLPWPFHKDLPSVGPGGSCAEGGNALGMLCSLSIPIVTLCALILLLIIVALFDLFFRWIPLLFWCFPFPKLGAKR